LVCALRRLNAVVLAGHVSIIGIERGACGLVAHGWLTVRWRASITSTVSLVVGRLLLVVAALVVSSLVVVHFVARGVVLVVSTGLALGDATEPAGPVHGLHASPTVPSCDAPVATRVSINYA
jgi:hypothetical protein